MDGCNWRHFGPLLGWTEHCQHTFRNIGCSSPSCSNKTSTF